MASRKTSERKFPDGIRERIGHSTLQLSLDISDAIIVLLDAKLPVPALSLARPLFESYVRGLWLLNYASDEQVNEFLSGKCPKVSRVIAAIGKDQEGHGFMQTVTRIWSLTHGGSEHVKRRNKGDSVEPNYPEQELESLVKFGDEIRIRIGAEFLSRLNDEEAIEQLHERVLAFRAEPLT